MIPGLRARLHPSRLLRPLLILLALLMPAALKADMQDLAAASRSVVRVALVATDGESAYFVGHGSGVVVAPGRVLTNAHVVEVTRSESNIVIGIIPAEGSKSFGGKVIAYSPGNDLALIAFDPAANLPVGTFYSGVPQDGQQVTAIGYPGSVDRAQGMNLQDIIHPMSPIRTTGTVSTGRTSKQFDTILHTAQLAAGNSGGPLVDECGRVLGVNSFGSVSDGNDAEYGFAVSDREIAAFLLKAGVKALRTAEPCKSLAEIDAAQKVADEEARAQAAARASQDELAAREHALSEREKAQQAVIARRENMMALAALLLVAGVAAGGAAFLSASKQGEKTKLFAGISAGLVLLAIIAFLLRPGFDSISGSAAPDNAANAANAAGNEAAATEGTPVGDNLCRIDTNLSRVTVSDTADVSFHWDGQGCINGQTQMVKEGASWTRIIVPASEAAISRRRFDPETGTYRSDKYLVANDVVEQARTLRGSIKWQGCTADPQRLAELARLQGDIAALLPTQPNERLVYHCGLGGSGAKPQTPDEER
ncbi:MAG: trypsin-like peptidase domain-containing protein [Sphingobium sp.]|nr:trypsin-like peptidase domain-containing protein [Sphingobium sp.]